MTFVKGPKRLKNLLVFYWPFKGQERRCLIFKINNNEDSKIPFVKYSLLDTILLYRLVKSSWNWYNPESGFQHFIFTECQPDWIISGFETCGLSWTRKWKWAKSYTSKGVAGATSSWSCRNEDIGVRPFKCMRTNVWLFFPRTLSYFYSYLGFSYHYYWWWRQKC